MTPEEATEKAEHLANRFYNSIQSYLGESQKKENAKQCALTSQIHIIYVLNHRIRDIDVAGNVLLDLIKDEEMILIAINNL